MDNCGKPYCKGYKDSAESPFKGTCGLPDCHNEAAGGNLPSTRLGPGGQREEDCGIPGCMDPEGKEVCLYRAREKSTDYEMDNCGKPYCKGYKDESAESPFKGTCGLPDCHNEAAGGSQPSTRRGPGGQREEDCGIPGCMDPEGKEVCLYRAREKSPWGRLNDLSKLFWASWKKIKSNPYYWGLLKSSTFFILGLKLFRDLALEFRPVPKCRR